MSEAPRPFPTERTAVVTGAGGPRGIGRTLATRLAGTGWSLAVLDVQGDGVRRLKQELADAGHTAVVALETDITSPESVDAAFAQIDAELPPVVGLANLAGIPSPERILDISVNDFRKVLDVNVTGSFLMLRAAARRMRTTGVGRIVNTSSVTAFDGGGTFSKGVYAAAKAGVLGLTRGGARELGEYGITVNAVAPGPVDTDIMGGQLTDERKQTMSAGIPVGRVGSTDDIAAAIAFLMSEEAGYISGATLQIDGGKHMH